MANPLDIVYSRKDANGTGFTEKTLVPVPNYFVICGPCGDLTTWTGSIGSSVSASYAATASIASSASFATSASWAPATGLGTGSTYPFTSSQAISSSFAQNAINALAADFALLAGDAVTATNATNATAADFALLAGDAITATTASWAKTASLVEVLPANLNVNYYIPFLVNTGSQPVYVDTSSIYYNPSQNLLTVQNISASYITASVWGTGSWAITASFAMNAGGGGTGLSTGSTYPITASHAVSASWAPGGGTGLETGSTYPITSSQAESASWALSASWAPGGTGTGLETGSTYPFTSSWAVSASWAPTFGSGLETGSTYPVTSSWAESSSWAPSTPVDLSVYLSSSWTGSNVSQFSGTSSFATQLLANTYTLEPNGFVNRTDSELSYSNDAKRIDIYPTSLAGYDIFSRGVKYNYTTTQSVTIDNATSGSAWYVYYDKDTHTLISSSTVWTFGVGHVPTAVAYWDGERIALTDERHGCVMDEMTHRYLHQTLGPRYANGLTGIFTGSAGRFSIGPGNWYDEDVQHAVTTLLTDCRIAYHSGSMIVLPATSSFTNGQMVWNDITTGDLTALVSVEYGAWFIYAVGGLENVVGEQILTVIGQRNDTSLLDARANNTPETLVFGEFPYEEAKLLYRVIFQGNGTYQETTDYRSAQYAGTSFTPTSHGALSGLTDDDHQQYLLLAGRTGGQTVTGGVTSSFLGDLSGSKITASAILVGTILPLASTIGKPNDPFTTVYATNLYGTASQAISASWAPSTQFGLETGSTYPFTASQSITASYVDGYATQEALDDLAAVTVVQGSYLVEGGQVIWIQDYTYTVTAATYYINGVRFTSSFTTVDLSGSNPVDDRIDVIAVNNSSSVVVLTGTASSEPAKANVDPDSQLELTFVYVQASTTAPSGSSTIPIYREYAGPPTEWTGGVGPGETTINLQSTNFPYSGSKCIEATNVVPTHSFTFVTASLFIPSPSGSLSFYIRSKAAWPSRNRGYFGIQWHSGSLTNLAVRGAQVLFQDRTFGFTSSYTAGYQPIAIPMSRFSIPSGLPINGFRVYHYGGQAFGYYLDNISINAGSPTTTPSSTGLTREQADLLYLKQSANLSDVLNLSASRANLQIGLATGSTYPITASWAISASWAPTIAGSGLETGSTYPFTSSWAVSASWAPGGSGTGLATGSTYPITASHALTASYVPGGAADAFISGGNSWGQDATLGLNDRFKLILIANTASRAAVTTGSLIVYATGSAIKWLPDAITNSEFTTNLNGWTYVDGEWFRGPYFGGSAVHVAGNTGILSQSIYIAPITPYFFEIAVGEYQAGNCSVYLNAQQLIFLTSNDSRDYVVYPTYTGNQDIRIVPSSDWSASITEVKLTPMTEFEPLVSFKTQDGRGIAEIRAGSSSTAGYAHNFAFGQNAMQWMNANGNVWSNLAIGRNTMNQTMDASDISFNVVVGHDSFIAAQDGQGVFGVTAYDNLIFGVGNLEHYGDETTFNVIIGDFNMGGSAPTLTGSNYWNVMIGSWIATDGYKDFIGNTFVGQEAASNMTKGQLNILIGYAAGLDHETMRENVAIGIYALAGNGFVAGFSSSHEIAIGSYALGNVRGPYNVGIGRYAGNALGAGEGNIAIGREALSRIDSNGISGSYLVAIGTDAASKAEFPFSNSVALGWSSSITQSGEFVVGGYSDDRQIQRWRPGSDAYTDLGSADYRFKNIYVQYFSGQVATASYLLVTGSMYQEGYGLTGSYLSYYTASFTMSYLDNSKVVTLASTESIFVNIPSDLVYGFSCTLYQSSSGTVTLTTGSGVVLRNRSGHLSLAGTYAVGGIFRVQNGDFVLTGDTA